MFNFDTPSLFCFSVDVLANAWNYSPGMIASLGHTEAQVPQSIQVSGSMW